MRSKDEIGVTAAENEPDGETLNWLNSFVERRKERRVQIEFPATLFWTDEAREEIIEQAFTLSVSNAGASFLVRRSLPVGDNIRVIMHIGANSGISLAEIKWSMPVGEGYRIGVSFRSDSVS
jgi:PilZ domain-containing protein